MDNLIHNKFLVNNGDDEKLLKKAKYIFSQHGKLDPFIFVNITTACNLRCSYCFTGYEREREILNLSIEDVNFIIEAIREIKKIKPFYNKPKIVFFGGEPLLPTNRKVIEYIFDKLMEFDPEIEIVTNAVYLIDFIDLLNKYNKMIKYIKITLSGPREIHNQVKKSINNVGTYDISINNIKYVINNVPNIILYLSILLAKYNLDIAILAIIMN
ncbi:radical SAM protein [Caloranaerobacter sp. DY30410]|uniref:radical SAM protein n=1 Tax=Caloranaerobacter sp. DY30410 TaxID=3238305 RepID=UPI003D08BD7B